MIKPELSSHYAILWLGVNPSYVCEDSLASKTCVSRVATQAPSDCSYEQRGADDDDKDKEARLMQTSVLTLLQDPAEAYPHQSEGVQELYQPLTALDLVVRTTTRHSRQTPIPQKLMGPMYKISTTYLFEHPWMHVGQPPSLAHAC